MQHLLKECIQLIWPAHNRIPEEESEDGTLQIVCFLFNISRSLLLLCESLPTIAILVYCKIIEQSEHGGLVPSNLINSIYLVVD